MSWKIDSAHSEINFAVRHMMISNVRGRFEKFSGTVDFVEDNPTQSTVDVQIETASINTKEEARDTHLKSADFFNAEKYPYLTFQSKKVEVLDANHGRLTGNLTIRDVTKQVVLDVEYSGQAKNPWGMTGAGFSASTAINRKDWGLTWNVGLETGGVLVGDEIKINIEVEIVKQAEEEKEAVPA
jgi:polyisoprenoid-binding protein YceI